MFDKYGIPNFGGSVFDTPTKEEINKEKELTKQFLKNGGTIKDYGTSYDTYKTKKRLKKC